MQQLDEILDRVLAATDGALVAAVAGVDGLVIEQRPSGSADLSLCVAELSGAITSLRRALDGGLDAGPIGALQVESERLHLLVVHATSQHYVVVALASAANAAPARASVAAAAAAVRELVA